MEQITPTPEVEVTHVVVDEQGNEVKVVQLPDGSLQDAEFSDNPEGN